MREALQTHKEHPLRPLVALFSPYGYLSVCTSVLNAAILWESGGYGVDIFVPASKWELPSFDQADIRVRQVPAEHGGRLTRHAFAFWAARAAGGTSYTHTVGYDQQGLSAAALVARRSGCRYSYHSLELWLREDVRGSRDRFDKAVETFCARRAQLTIAQDATRVQALCQDLGLLPERTAIVPNTPLGLYAGGRSTYLREKFGIGEDTLIVLQSGSLIKEHKCLEVMESVSAWPEGFVLVVHGWAPDPRYRELILEVAAQARGRIHVSFDVLPIDMVDSLYASADVGLSLYGSPNVNFESIGNAAGKVFRFMRVGVPVIVQDLPGLKELVQESGCGAALRGVADIPGALDAIGRGRGGFSQAAREAFGEFEFSRHYERVLTLLGFA